MQEERIGESVVIVCSLQLSCQVLSKVYGGPGYLQYSSKWNDTFCTNQTFCINQQDIAERSAQVLIMRNICSSAQQVMIRLDDNNISAEDVEEIVRTQNYGIAHDVIILNKKKNPEGQPLSSVAAHRTSRQTDNWEMSALVGLSVKVSSSDLGFPVFGSLRKQPGRSQQQLISQRSQYLGNQLECVQKFYPTLGHTVPFPQTLLLVAFIRQSSP
jgi:hypothetical protein